MISSVNLGSIIRDHGMATIVCSSLDSIMEWSSDATNVYAMMQVTTALAFVFIEMVRLLVT